MNDVRQTLDSLYDKLYDCKSSEQKGLISNSINVVLSKAFEVDRLTLFLATMSAKQFYKTFSNLLKGEEVSDFEVGRSLSSLLNYSLNEMKNFTDNYQLLHIAEQSTILNKFLIGEVTQQEVKEFISKYMEI